MKKYIKNIALIAIAVFALTSCEGDKSFGEEIFDRDDQYPYVSIQDRNEDLEGIVGNNFWGFTLTPEADGNSVRVAYDTQDPNITNHQIYVGFDSNDASAPLDTDALVETLTTFPTELTFTKGQIASALGVSVDELNDNGSVYFRGRSTDGDGNVVDDPSVFEDFLAFERHAYFYEWPLN